MNKSGFDALIAMESKGLLRKLIPSADDVLFNFFFWLVTGFAVGITL